MSRTKTQIVCAACLTATAIIFSGCAGDANANLAKTTETNQATLVNNSVLTNTNTEIAVNAPTMPPANAPMTAPPANAPTTAPPANVSVLAPPKASATVPPANGKPPAPMTAEPTPIIGSGASDFFLFKQVRVALNAKEEFVNTVIVDTKEGNIVLTGKVANAEQKARAEQIVKSVPGVKSVKNSLTVGQ